jgi:DNA-binding response OmpR family regulator
MNILLIGIGPHLDELQTRFEEKEVGVIRAPEYSPAVAKVIGEKLAAIVLFLNAGTLDPGQICREIKSNPETAQVPVVLLTEKENIRDLVKASYQGFDFSMAEPLHPYQMGYLCHLLS